MENFEEQIRNKLRDAEVEPPTDAWQRISEAIPARRSQAVLWWTVGGIAAGLTWLFAVGGAWFMPSEEAMLSQTCIDAVELPSPHDRVTPISVSANVIEPLLQPQPSMAISVRPMQLSARRVYVDEMESIPAADVQLLANLERPVLHADSMKHSVSLPRKSFFKGWHVGMGAASMGVTGANWSLSDMEIAGEYQMDLVNSSKSDNQIDIGQAFCPSTIDAAPADADHSASCLFGVSFYRPLTEDLSLSTGVVYSQLVSRWNSNGNKSVQRLHLLGIPISLNYRICSFGAFRVYASAGTQMDINVGGRIKMTESNGSVQKRSLHSDNLLWTLRGRVGVAYPLFRWASLYGECGVDRYLNAPSGINTLRSEEKTGYIGQIGVSIGF